MAVVLGRPHLWLTGALGFSLRGGIVLLILPILVLPTPIEARLLLGSSLASTGLTAGFWTLAAVASAVCSVVLLILLLAIARLEVAAFEHLVRDPETADLRGWRPAPRISPARRRQIIGWVSVVQALGLMAIVLSAAPLATAIGPTLLEESVRPSSTGGILLRLLDRLAPQIVIIAAVVLVVELLSAATTRHVLARGYGLWRPRPGRRAALVDGSLFAAQRMLGAPAATAATAATGWLASLVVLAPAVWALGAVWQTTRASFLSTTSVADLLSQPAALPLAVLLAAVLLAALLLAGLAAAFRAASWTVEMLRQVEQDRG